MDDCYAVLLRELSNPMNWRTADSNIMVDDVSGEEVEILPLPVERRFTSGVGADQRCGLTDRWSF